VTTLVPEDAFTLACQACKANAPQAVKKIGSPPPLPNAQFCKLNPCSWLKFLLDLIGADAPIGEDTTIVDDAQMIRKAAANGRIPGFAFALSAMLEEDPNFFKSLMPSQSRAGEGSAARSPWSSCA
jgi:hypothetical protein